MRVEKKMKRARILNEEGKRCGRMDVRSRVKGIEKRMEANMNVRERVR